MAAHNKGVNRKEIAETIGIAIQMGGGPSTGYMAQRRLEHSPSLKQQIQEQSDGSQRLRIEEHALIPQGYRKQLTR